MGRNVFFRAAGLAFAVAACGGSAPPPPANAPPASNASPSGAPSAAPELPPPASNVLARSAVHRAVARGLGAFLQNVIVDDRPVMADGKFKGFRIAALNDGYFHGVDLKPGDVVLRVNGFPIEHPEQALEAFRSLEVASELRVELERAGTPRELRYAIVDDGAPAPAPAATVGPPAASSNLRSR